MTDYTNFSLHTTEVNMNSKFNNIIKIIAEDKNPRKLMIGFDGFIDEIIQVVDKRFTTTEYHKIKTITTFAKRINAAAGLSANMELVPTDIKIGGNGVIMANCMVQYGMNIDYVGALGFPELNPLFSQFQNQCHSVISFANPGHTQALEFDDGKLMLGKINPIHRITWQNLIKEIELSKLKEMIISSDFIAFTNWTMLAGLNEIISEFAAILKENNHQPIIFFDLADPAKRCKADVIEILTIISDLNRQTDVILGLNEKESRMIADYLDIPEAETLPRSAAIRAKLNINTVLIHPVNGSAAAIESEAIWVDGPYTPTPKLTTGAGDNFNAGFCLGRLLNMNLKDALILGVYTSGYYVRNCHSPSRQQFIEFIRSFS